MGYSPDMQQIAPQQILMGRYLNEVDELRQRKVCVIGLQVWRDLFPGGEDPTGKTIQIGSSYFTVVGVTKPLGGMMASATRSGPSSSRRCSYSKCTDWDGRSTCWHSPDMRTNRPKR